MVILFVTLNHEKKGKAVSGGLVSYLRHVTGALVRLGHTPIILSLGDYNGVIEEEGVEIHFLKRRWWQMESETWSYIFNTLGNNWEINKQVEKLIKEKNVDIIQFTSVSGTAMWYHGRVPAVMRLSSYEKVYKAPLDSYNKIFVNVQSFGERWAASRCNAIFGPSNFIAKPFSRDIHRPVSIIESPFSDDVQKLDESLYREYLQGKKYFLHTGRLCVEKGILVIADVLPKFFEMHPDYYFVCCGIFDGKVYGESALNVLKKAVGKYWDRMIFLEKVPHEKLYPIIRNAEFTIQPSLSENFSNSCMEQMYFGRVVIGTDGISFEQLIEDGKSGLLCKPNDAASLLAKMNQVVSMGDEQKEQIGKAARRRIDKLQPEIVVNKLLRYYQYVIDNVNRKK